jgi:hypothetical protein
VVLELRHGGGEMERFWSKGTVSVRQKECFRYLLNSMVTTINNNVLYISKLLKSTF